MMTARQKTPPERHCIITGEVKPVEGMIRLVPSPDGILTPDVAQKLPGRGMWISADGALIGAALEDGRFLKGIARALKARASKDMIPNDLMKTLDHLLLRKCLDRLGIEQKASRVVTGFDKIKAAIGKSAQPAMLFTANDAGDDGKRKMRNAVGYDIAEITLFTRDELSLALGKGNVVHALLLQGGGLDKLQVDIDRLNGLRGALPQQ